MKDRPRGGRAYINWLLSLNGNFPRKLAWNELRSKGRKFPWASLIWHKKFILRHSIILWLAIKQRPTSKDKLLKIRITNDASCVLCNKEEEDSNHFFFQCEYSHYIWGITLRINNVIYDGHNWGDYIENIAME